MKVCVSGTFNILHQGHKHLLDKAFQTAGKNGIVFIGITEGKMLEKKQFRIPYNIRKNALCEYLIQQGYDKQAVIQKSLINMVPLQLGILMRLLFPPRLYKMRRRSIKKG